MSKQTYANIWHIYRINQGPSPPYSTGCTTHPNWVGPLGEKKERNYAFKLAQKVRKCQDKNKKLSLAGETLLPERIEGPGIN